MKTGKKPAQYDAKLLHLSDFESVKVPVIAPIGYGHYQKIKQNWGMLGNDRVGDCVLAGADHETMILTSITGKTASFTEGTAVSDYSAITGYNPRDPSTDQGTYMKDAMSYRRHTGILDSNNKRHKVGAYLALEPGNWTQLLQALYAFTVVGIGIEFPDSAMDQYFANKPWTVVKGSAVDRGHYIPVVGRPTSTYLEIVTWGRAMRMSETFYKKYNDESYVFISNEGLVNGISPEGYNLTDLNNILAAL